MKQLLFLISLLTLLSVNLNAQFVLSKDGFASASGENYIIKEVPNKSAIELYNSALTYIMKSFKNPNQVASKIEGSLITVHGYFKNAIPCAKWLGIDYADVDMNITMQFKDGKIRFDAPVINKIISYQKLHDGQPTTYLLYGGSGEYFGEGSLFDKNNKVKNKMAVPALNDLISNFISGVIESANNKDNW